MKSQALTQLKSNDMNDKSPISRQAVGKLGPHQLQNISSIKNINYNKQAEQTIAELRGKSRSGNRRIIQATQDFKHQENLLLSQGYNIPQNSYMPQPYIRGTNSNIPDGTNNGSRNQGDIDELIIQLSKGNRHDVNRHLVPIN